MAHSATVAQAWSMAYDAHLVGSGMLSRFVVPDGRGNFVLVENVRTPDYTYEVALTQYDAGGRLLWRDEDTRVGTTRRTGGVAIDSQGNVHVVINGTVAATNTVYRVIKDSPTGVRLWTVDRIGPYQRESGSGLTLDDTGCVYVGGGASIDGKGKPAHIQVVKYDRDGKEVWVAQSDPIDGKNYAVQVVGDGQGNTWVLGNSTATGAFYGALAVTKFDALGTVQWNTLVRAPGALATRAVAIATCGDGSVYVAGTKDTFQLDWVVSRLDAGGAALWLATYSTNERDLPAALAVDREGNAYVTGWTFDGNDQFLTLKWNASGQRLWAIKDSSFQGQAGSVLLDAAGFVYVFGDITSPPWGYAVRKYHPVTAQMVWSLDCAGAGNQGNSPGLAIDESFNLYVTGESWLAPDWGEYLLLRYTQSITEVTAGGVFHCQRPVPATGVWRTEVTADFEHWETLPSSVDATGMFQLWDAGTAQDPARFYRLQPP